MPAIMVGMAAMGPEPVEIPADWVTEEEAEKKRGDIMKRYERIGAQIIGRAGHGSVAEGSPIPGILSDRDKRTMVAQLLGQAYVTAYNLVDANRPAVERIADVLIEKREMYGDEVVELLDSANLVKPRIDPLSEDSWPEV